VGGEPELPAPGAVRQGRHGSRRRQRRSPRPRHRRGRQRVRRRGARSAPDPDLAGLVARFEDAARAAGRDPADVDRYLNLDSSPRFSLESADLFAECVERARALGFTDVLTHWPRTEGIYAGREAVLEEVAARLLALRDA